MDTFGQTVQKARRFALTTAMPKPRKTVPTTTPPARDSIKLLQDDVSIHKKIDLLHDMIRRVQTTNNAPLSNTHHRAPMHTLCHAPTDLLKNNLPIRDRTDPDQETVTTNKMPTKLHDNHQLGDRLFVLLQTQM